MQPLRVVIVGGGFAAVKFAKTLRDKLPASACEILLFNRENHMVFHPLLADVAGASINADAAAPPLRQMLPEVECRTESVQRIDTTASEIAFDDANGALARLHYDHVVIACGAESNLGIIPGMTEHAFPFKVVRDALELRQHIVRQMENAEASSDPERRRWYLSFIIVGAGFSGTEVGGEINELVRSSTRFYRNFHKEDVTVTLVHSQDQILPEVAPNLRQFAQKRMEKAGITMLLNTRAVAATHEGIQLQDGRMLGGGTIVCTIGTTTSPIVQQLDVPKERGRIRTAPDMRIEGQTNAWAIGDCALIVNAFDSKPSAPTAQFAERQGRQAALNLVRFVRGEPTQPFRFKALGQLCSIGGYEAVAEMLGMRISGFPAWFIWRSVYLFKLPTWSRRIKVAFDWAWDLVFPRDLSFLNTDTAQEVTHAYYREGDFIHHRGDLARVFSIVEEGEVEVLQPAEESPEAKVIVILGKGDFFGEEALLANRPHTTSIRARTVVRLAQIGSARFSEMASAFPPLRDLIAKAVTRHSGDLWRYLPLAKPLLADETIASLMDPPPGKLLSKETTFADAVAALNESATGYLLVLDEKQQLWATLDREDLYRIIARIAVSSNGMRPEDTKRKLGDLLYGDRVYASLEDSALTASATMLDHGISWLPVVQGKNDLRPVGCLRGDRISNRIVEKLGHMQTDRAQAAG
ncbi:MAG: FAD-dependent oxidoreductase [Candidatus Acidiferrales bacterium]